MRQKIAAGNWKMNGTAPALTELDALAAGLPATPPLVIVCPPAPLLIPAVDRASGIAIGAQDCHTAPSGAHTGDISAPMIADTGASFVIVGHSERREDHGETDAAVRAKAEAAQAAGLCPIVCIGESLSQRETGETLHVIGAQLAASLPETISAENTVVAYEPIWAIGTGKVPSVAQIAEVHDFIRAELENRYGPDVGAAVSLLYGGSVKPDNAAAIFEVDNVDGALVGGASLKAGDFLPIIAALANS
ncbi:triose-phosphate isomerase [Marimonas sp. MJW-29]|uniref:Triosephosphate isomerase n=1 Tax=Sulfitobacter sediminis TaxID=3234186 RepID=A0ABV3RI42_9RHOB